MALVSSKVAAGVRILADHFNKLYTDLVTNHDHSSGQGGAVDHADLSESGPMSGISKEHGDIDLHIEGAGSITDSPGGNKGVHDLASAAFVAGSLPSQGVLDWGTIAVGSGDSGTQNFTGTGFDSAPAVSLTPLLAAPTYPGETQAMLTAVTASDFSWKVSSSPHPKPTTIHWMAIGNKT